MSENKDFLENLFDNFLKGPTIFKNREVLRPDYIPDHLPHRNDQIKEIGIIEGSQGKTVLQIGSGKYHFEIRE